MASSTESATRYSVPSEARSILHQGILNNPLHRSQSFPLEIHEAAECVHFVGGDKPIIPVNWRFAESISSIKGFQAVMVNVLLKRRFGVEYQKVEINTDHANLFIASILFGVIDPGPGGENVKMSDKPQLYKYIPNGDIYKAFSATNFHTACTNIYKTKDGRFFHLHGSLNTAVPHKALGISSEIHCETLEDATSFYGEKISEYTAAELETLMNDENRQAGTTCWTTEEFKESEHGKANAHVGLYEIHYFPNPSQKPTWWDDAAGITGYDAKDPSRPLLGLEIVDLTRIIASPTITRELAELGASVMRITSPNVTDATDLLMDLAWGKWNAHLDLKTDQGKERLKELILEADIVVDGYRPGIFEKYGFGKDDILKLVEGRDRGIIYVRENCYGWNGPLAHRSGWQQISDAHCGVSYEFGKAIGSDGPVTPIFPNSDYATGATGATATLHAIIQRAEKGGSFVVDTALNYYSQWLVNSCGTYPLDVWAELWGTYNNPTFKSSQSMMFSMIAPTLLLIMEKNGKRFLNEDFFTVSENKAIGKNVRRVKPILNFVEGMVKPGYNVGFRGNGVDKPRWPNDLMTEIVV